MREILFRGLSVESNEWVEGHYHYHDYVVNGETSRIFYIQPINSKFSVAVNPETVGQFSGLYDVHGNKIFDGDIIKYEGSIAVVCFGEYGPVDSRYATHVGFYVKWRKKSWNRVDLGFWAKEREIAVIGTVYD